MPGLVLEGGTFRPIFSCGVMDALLEHDIMFDYVIGVSAGITDGVSYISRQKERNLRVIRAFRNDPRYISIRNYLRGGSLFGLNFVYEEVPQRYFPFDWRTYHAYKGRILIGVTNARTGQAEYLDGMQLDRKCTMLRATCAIPFYFPPIRIGDELYYDGGLSDSIPIRKSLQDGNRKNLIILTQPAGYRKDMTRSTLAAARALRPRFPKLSETMRRRPKMYNDTVCFCEQLAKKQPADTVLLRPDEPIHSFERDVNRLTDAYHAGYRMAEQNMSRIRALFD
ncbi:MAG: patatin family protein [Clostridiaceae bacterium]|nr:patatin family protein [Clostridiaceae bacterium]